MVGYIFRIIPLLLGSGMITIGAVIIYRHQISELINIFIILPALAVAATGVYIIWRGIKDIKEVPMNDT